MNIDEMQAGRELDALIAEKVMGYTLNYEFAIPGIRMPTIDVLRDKYDEWGEVPWYSTDIADAWQVVERLWKLDFNVRVDVTSKIRVHAWKKNLNEYGPMPVSALTDTAPLAICRVALKAVDSVMSSEKS